MFRNRSSSQKPGDELYASFRQSFPEIIPTTSPATTIQALSNPIPDVAIARGYVVGIPSPFTSQLDDFWRSAVAEQDKRSGGVPGIVLKEQTGLCADHTLTPTMDYRHLGLEHEELKDAEPTPRAFHDQWRLTPSLLDPNSFAFASFANQPPGYYTPTPGGTNTLYHPQAGDLHTPGGFVMGLGTPLSMPTTEGVMHAASTMDVHGFHPQTIHPHQFHNINPFAPHPSFVPSQLSHHPQVYETMDPTDHSEPLENVGMDPDMQEESPLMAFASDAFNSGMPLGPVEPAVKFRYHVTLNAPTAMIRHADEIPITYLNKGQAYSVSIVDTAPTMPPSPHTKYRTFIRISFEDEEQRQRPAACWQLWKEGRGTNEAHQRGGRLQAVEYVDPNQSSENDHKRSNVELETASFDGFSVIWSPGQMGSADCSVAVRFNFLSTDFSHSKGVKGIPVRFCAKTQVYSSGSPHSIIDENPEVCYCKVKLFRDHGAERKLSNDVAHVKKTIDKLKQQIAQAEAGVKDFGKRKRNSIATKPPDGNRPGKAPKHKRTWSMSSAPGSRPSAEDDLHSKLATMQDMFTSTRSVSILYLKGTEQDDPDQFPVRLSGEPVDLLKADKTIWEPVEINAPGSSLVSPSPSSTSRRSPSRQSSGFQLPAPLTQPPSQPLKRDPGKLQPPQAPDLQSSNPQKLASPPDQASKVPKLQQEGSTESLDSWIEAIGVDASYRPPPERTNKPVASLYILPQTSGDTGRQQYYRAVYLMRRTAQELVQSVAAKCEIDPSRVTSMIRVNSKGLSILVDDDVVRELPEGQDMFVEIGDGSKEGAIKQEMGMVNTPTQSTLPTPSTPATGSGGYQLRLIY